MKKVLTLIAFVCSCGMSMAQEYTCLEPIFFQNDWGLGWGNREPIDMKNDGTMQLMIGSAEGGFTAVVQKNGDAWEAVASFTGANDRPSFNVCDMNGDGIMDVVVSETRDNADTQGIFLGNGDGTFSKAHMIIVDAEEGLPAHFANPFSNFANIQSSYVADFNNDGLPDIVGIGSFENYVVLLNQGGMKFHPIYFDPGTEYGKTGYNISQAVVIAGDVNNDGYQDIVTCFWLLNVGEEQGHDRTYFSEVYLNDGTGTSFERTFFADTNASQGNGGVALGDLNGDGYLDIVMNGYGGLYAGTPGAIEDTGNDWTSVWDRVNVSFNDGTGHFTLASKELFDRPLVKPYHSSPNILNLFDWNGDGYLDIITNGHTPEDGADVFPGEGYCAGYIYLNNQDGTPGKLARKYYYAGGAEGTNCIMDWDGDGLKDIIGTGWLRCDKVDTYVGRRFTVNKSTEQPTPAPTAPTDITANVDDKKVTLSWTPAYGAPACTTYELYIKAEDGTIYGNCRAYIEGANEGLRKCEQPGNLGMIKTITYTLPAGTYEWGVQAVDGRWVGSKFTKGTFTIDGEAPVASSDLKTIFFQNDWGLGWGNREPIDMKNDGTMQLMIGSAEGGFTAVVQKNGDAWEAVASFTGANDRPSFNVCDMNGDGIMDVVVSETRDNADTQGIFLGNGDGTFTKTDMIIVDAEEGLPAHFANPFSNFANIQSSYVADFNNDGLPDIVGVGSFENYVVLLNQGDMKFHPVYFDPGTEYGKTGYNIQQAVVIAGDVNNDSYQDIVVCCRLLDIGGGEGHDREYFSEVYLNDGTGTSFERTFFADTNASQGNGGVALGDLNGDGYLDIIMNGYGGLYAGTPGAIEDTGNDWTPVWDRVNVSFNDGTGHFTLASKELFDRPLVKPYHSSPNILNLFDWNGDGYLDIITNGHTPEDGADVFPGEGYCAGYIYLNNQDGTPGKLARKQYYAGGAEGTNCIMDWDGDGLKDILGSGWLRCDKVDTYVGRRFSVNKCEEKATEAPAVPTNIQATVNGNKVTLTWTPAAGAPTCTTYELYIKKADGTLLGNCRAYIEGANEGLRKCEKPGNLGMVKTITYTLPIGTYEWGVQAVDGRWVGSKFAKGSFSIADPTTIISNYPAVNSSSAHYNLAGQQINANTKGVQFVKNSNGTIKKVIR